MKLGRGYGWRLTLGLMGALVLVGCGGRATSQTQASSKVKASVCQAVNVVANLGKAHRVAGAIAYAIALDNTGRETCTLDGFPTLQLEAGGANVATRQLNGVARISGMNTKPKLVHVPAGRQASFLLLYKDVSKGVVGCPVDTQLVVEWRGGGGTVTANFNLSSKGPCSGKFWVYPMVAGVVNPS